MQILSIMTKNTHEFQIFEFSMLHIYSKTFFTLNDLLLDLQDGYFKVLDYIDTNKLNKTLIVPDKVIFNKPFVKTSLSILAQIEADNPVIQKFSLGTPKVTYYYSNSIVSSTLSEPSGIDSTQAFNDFIEKRIQTQDIPEHTKLQLRSKMGSQIIHTLLKAPKLNLQYNELTKQCTVTYSSGLNLILNLTMQEFTELNTKQNLTIVFSEDLYIESVLKFKVIELPRLHLFDIHKNLNTLHFPEWVNLKPSIAKLIMKQYPEYELPEPGTTNNFFTKDSIKDKFKNNLKLIKRRHK